MNECLTEPDVCPACNDPWSASGQCSRCGLLLTDALDLIRLGCAAFARARDAAQGGRFAEAREYLAVVRSCGMRSVYGHPAVERLAELCAAASGETGALGRLIAGEERAARSAAARGDFRAAAFYAGRAAAAAPGILTLQKLYLLTLYGAGRMRAAADLRQRLRHLVPGDADLIRWSMSELDALDHLPLRQVAAPAAPRPLVAAAVGCVIGTLALLVLTGRNSGKSGERTV